MHFDEKKEVKQPNDKSSEPLFSAKFNSALTKKIVFKG